MSSPLNMVSPTTKIDPFQAARTLGNLLSQTPEYKAFIEAQKAVNSDPTSYTLSVQMHGHQNAIQCGRDPDGEHAADLMRMELEREDLPVIKEFYRARREVGVLFRAVDKIISQEAGMDFAINAQHSSCGCCG